MEEVAQGGVIGVLVKKADMLQAYLHPPRTHFSWVTGIL